jgi:hypothetical protein
LLQQTWWIMKKLILLVVLALVSLGAAAVTKTFNVASGTWNTGGNWNPSGEPSSSDSVVIPNGATVTISSSAVCQALAIGSGGTATAVDITSGSLAVTNGIHFLQVTGSVTHDFRVNGATVTCQFVRFADNANATMISRIYITSGWLTVSDDILMLGSGNENTIEMTVWSSILMVGGAFSSGGTLITSGAVYFNGSRNQNIPNYIYQDLAFTNGGGYISYATANLTINGTLYLLSGRMLDMGVYKLTLGGSTSGTGWLFTACTDPTPIPENKSWSFKVFYYSASTQIIVGGAYIQLEGTGGNRILSSTATITIGNHFIPGSGTYTTTGSTFNFNGSNLVIPVFPYNNLTIAGFGTLTAGGNLTISGTLTLSNTFDMGTYQLSGAQTTAGSGTIRTACVASQALPSGISWYGTVEYYSASAQTITPGYYTNLNATGGNRTLPSGSTVGISNGFTPGSGTYTVTGSTMDFNGSNHNIPSFSFNNLTLSGSGTKTALGNLNVAGNLDINGTSILEMSTYTLSSLGGNQTNSGKVRIASTASQPVPSGKSWYGTFEYYSASSQTIVPGFYTTLNGTGGNRVLSSTGNIAISNTFTPGSGTYTITGSTVEYNGGTQNLPAGFNYNNLNINGSGGKFALSDISIAGDLTIYGGVSFFTNTYQLTALSGSTFLIGTNGNLYTSCTSSTPLPAGKTWNFNVFYLSASAQTIVSGNYSFLSGTTGPRTLSSTGSIGISISFIPGSGAYTTTGSTVDYNGSGLQTIVAFNYHNLTSSSTGSRSLSSTGTVGVAGTFTPGTNSYSNTVSTIDFNGSATQTVPAFNYYNLTYSSSGTKNFAASGTIGIAGTFNPGSNPLMTVIGSTVDFNGTGSQTIPGYAYYNLTSSSSGSRTLSSSGTIYVANTFTPGTNSYTNTGSTITFTSSSSQTIPAFTYYNLESQSSGSRTLASSGTIGIAGTFTPGSGSYTITGSTINFNGSGTQIIPAFNYDNLTSSSTGSRTLASSGIIGIASTFMPGSNSYTVTGSTVDFNGVNQAVPGFDFNNLTLTNSSNKTVSGNLNIAGNLTVNTAAALDMGTNVLNTVSGSILGSGSVYTQNTSSTPLPAGKTWPLTVLYYSTSAQTIVHGNYSTLLAGTGGGARTLSPAGTIGISSSFSPGTGTYTITNSTIDFNGSSAQFIPTFNFNNLTISSSGSKSPSTNATIGIAGTFTTNSILLSAASGSTINFNGTGSQTIPANWYNNLTSSSTGTRTLASSGNIVVLDVFTPGTNAYTVSGSTLQFNGTGAQSIPAFTYNNLLSTSSGSRTLASSDTIKIYGTFTPGTNSYTTTGSTIDFKTETGSTLPVFNYNNLMLTGNNYVTWTAAGDISIAGNLHLNSGRILNMAVYRLLNVGGTTSGTGWLYTSSTAADPLPAGKTWNYKVFYPSSAVQTIVAGNYSDLEAAGGNRTLSSSGTIGISGIFTPGSGTYTVAGSTVEFNGSGTQTIPAMSYNNLSSSSTGNRTVAPSGTIFISGSLTPGTNAYYADGSTINFNGSSSQTIPAFAYYNLTSSSSGSRTLASSGTITVYGTFTPGTNSYTTTGSTLDLKTEGWPTLPVFNYNNLMLSGRYDVSWTAAGDISIAGNLHLNSSRILNMATNRLLNVGGTTSGTGWLYTSSTAADPLPAGKTWNYKVFYPSSAAQTIVAGNYSDLEAAGGNRTLSSSGTIGISGIFTPGSGTYTVAGSTVEFNGSGTQTIPAMSYNNLSSSSTGNRTVAPSGTIFISGSLTPGTNAYYADGSTINFNGSSSQTIPAFAYYNLTSSSSGSRTLASSGTITVYGTFTPGTNSYTTTGSTLDLKTEGWPTLPVFNYNNLMLSGRYDVSWTAAGDISIAGNLHLNSSRILNMATNRLLNVGGTTSGTGWLATSCTAADAIPSGKTWNYTVFYQSSSSQTIASGVYNNGLDAAGGNRILSPSGVISIPATFTAGSGTYTATGSTVDFTGTTQNIPAINYNNLTASGSGTKSAQGTLNIAGDLTIGALVTLSMGTNVMNAVGGNVLGAGTLTTQCTAAAPLPAGKSWTVSVNYNSSSAQTIVSGSYVALTASGGNRTLSSTGTIGVSYTFTPGSGTYTTTGSTVDYNGTGSQTIVAMNYNNLTFSSTGARSLPSSGTVGITGTFTPGSNSIAAITGSTVNFNGSGSQAIPAFNYNNLTSSSTGSRTLASSATINVSGTFTPGSNSYTTTGSTLNFNGSSSQSIPAFAYDNLTSSSTGARVLASSGNIDIGTAFTPGTNSYTTTGSTIRYTGSVQGIPAFTYNNLTLLGDAKILYSGTLINIENTLSDPLGLLNCGGGTTVAFIGGAQTVPYVYYDNLTIAGTGTKTASGPIALTGVLTVSSTLNMDTYSLSMLAFGSVSGNGTLITANPLSSAIPAGKNWSCMVQYTSVSAQNIVSGNYTNLNATGGNRTLSSTGTIGISGTFTPGAGTYTIAGSTVDFNGSGSQNIPAMSYHNLTSSSSGARTLPSSGTINIGGTFTPGTNAYTVTGSTVQFNGTAQSVPAFSFNNLTFAGSGASTMTGNVTVGGTLNLSTGNLGINGNTLTLTEPSAAAECSQEAISPRSILAALVLSVHSSWTNPPKAAPTAFLSLTYNRSGTNCCIGQCVAGNRNSYSNCRDTCYRWLPQACFQCIGYCTCCNRKRKLHYRKRNSRTLCTLRSTQLAFHVKLYEQCNTSRLAK